LGEDCEFLCGYEAGCLGYSLYHELTAKGIKCVIMAPSTIESAPVNKIKTDKCDAKKLARCLATGGYKAVYVPTDEDNAVKEYIRIRETVFLQLLSRAFDISYNFIITLLVTFMY